MERAGSSKSIYEYIEDEGPAFTDDGSPTLVQVAELPEDAKISPDKPGRRVHGAVDEVERYAQQRAMPPKPPKQNIFNPSTDSHARQFLEVMIRYQMSTNDDRVRSLDLNANHSWDEVIRSVKDKESEYLEAGRMRRVTRLITAHSESVLPYLRLIPNGFYTSIICGGLKLIFELSLAAVQVTRGREKVLATLSRIPAIILEAEHSVETFYPDPALYDKAEELYVAILTTIEGATEWMKQRPIEKQARALVSGDRYHKDFKEKVNALNKALETLQARASVLRDDAIITIRKTTGNVETVVNRMAITGAIVETRSRTVLDHVQNLQDDTKDMRFMTEHIHGQLPVVTHGIKNFTGKQDTMNGKINDVHAAQQTTHVRIDDLHTVQQATHSKVETLSYAQQAFEQAVKAMKLATDTAEWMEKDGRDIRRMKYQIQRLQENARGITRADLLDILQVTAEIPIDDFRRVHRACQSMEMSDSQMAQGIFEGARFKQWLSADSSAALFVEGGPSLAVHGRFASLSLMSCMAIDCLAIRAPAATIHHFCRRHISPKDPICGPQGMMRSLICQVLRLLDDRVDLNFMSGRRHREQLESYDLHMLCECFAKIIKQLPVDMVLFCVIDSIDCFEKHDWAEDCRFVMREIQDILYEYEYGPVFKLLVTSPVRSRYVGATFSSQNRLLLSGDDSASRDNPAERERHMGARRPRARESDSFRSLRNMFPADQEDSFDDSSDSDSS